MTPMARTVVRSAVGVAVTTGLAYLFDPESGQRRRQSLRDRCTGAAKRIGDGARVTTYDLTHRLNSVSARMKSKLSRDKSSDQALTKRVYAALWRALPHPGTINVVAHGGHVILYGDVAHAEHQHAAEIVRSVEGVHEVSDHLTESASVTEGRQGLTTVRRAMMSVRQFPMLKETWSPPTRVVSGVTARCNGGCIARMGGDPSQPGRRADRCRRRGPAPPDRHKRSVQANDQLHAP
jgi:osmotically-inducible protein OsmY